MVLNKIKMNEAELKWFNLKKNKCPKCSKNIYSGLGGLQSIDGILRHPCGFSISEKKFKKIVTSMVDQEIEENVKEKSD